MKIGNYNVQVDANGDLIEWEDDEFDIEEDDEFIGQMCSCDISGICGGPSCPQYYSCQM